MFMEGKKPASKLAAIAATIAIWVIAAGPARAAEAQAKPACGTSITACGCTINSGGNYTVANNLDATKGLTNKGTASIFRRRSPSSTSGPSRSSGTERELESTC